MTTSIVPPQEKTSEIQVVKDLLAFEFKQKNNQSIPIPRKLKSGLFRQLHKSIPNRQSIVTNYFLT